MTTTPQEPLPDPDDAPVDPDDPAAVPPGGDEPFTEEDRDGERPATELREPVAR